MPALMAKGGENAQPANGAPSVLVGMWALLDARGAQYPAEHHVGHLYVAKPSLVDHYRKLDPCNCFNPGIGKTSKFVRWGMRETTARDCNVTKDLQGARLASKPASYKNVGILGGAPRALVEFRSDCAAVDVFRLALALSFLRAICSIRLFGNSEIRRERLLRRYQQKYQQNGRLP
jgi:hypothetical protein